MGVLDGPYLRARVRAGFSLLRVCVALESHVVELMSCRVQ